MFDREKHLKQEYFCQNLLSDIEKSLLQGNSELIPEQINQSPLNYCQLGVFPIKKNEKNKTNYFNIFFKLNEKTAISQEIQISFDFTIFLKQLKNDTEDKYFYELNENFINLYIQFSQEQMGKITNDKNLHNLSSIRNDWLTNWIATNYTENSKEEKDIILSFYLSCFDMHEQQESEKINEDYQDLENPPTENILEPNEEDAYPNNFSFNFKNQLDKMFSNLNNKILSKKLITNYLIKRRTTLQFKSVSFKYSKKFLLNSSEDIILSEEEFSKDLISFIVSEIKQKNLTLINDNSKNDFNIALEEEEQILYPHFNCLIKKVNSHDIIISVRNAERDQEKTIFPFELGIFNLNCELEFKNIDCLANKKQTVAENNVIINQKDFWGKNIFLESTENLTKKFIIKTKYLEKNIEYRIEDNLKIFSNVNFLNYEYWGEEKNSIKLNELEKDFIENYDDWIIHNNIESKNILKEKENILLGIKFLLSFPKLNRAWILTNQALAKQNEIQKPSPLFNWKPFQIFYLISLIPLIALQYENIYKEAKESSIITEEKITELNNSLSLLFFNAGGGKTEAFLSAVVFSLFLDRLFNNNGINTIIKYPLRVVLTQQTQRILNLVSAAELVRLKNSSGFLEENLNSPFSVGLLIGRSTTPNNMNEEGLNYIPLIEKNSEALLTLNSRDNFAEEAIEIAQLYDKGKEKNFNSYFCQEDYDIKKYFDSEQKYKRISTCPFCKQQKICLRRKTSTHSKKITLLHFCYNKECEWNLIHSQFQEFTFFIVDDNIFDHNINVLISTTDKLAIFGQGEKTNSTFSIANKKYDNKLNQDALKIFGFKKITPFGLDIQNVSTPKILVQDETHLLTESLGSFSSIYEQCFLNFLKYIRPNNTLQTLIIAATATIKEPKLQLQPLYRRDNILLFPQRSETKKIFFASNQNNQTRRINCVIPSCYATSYLAISKYLSMYHHLIINAHLNSGLEKEEAKNHNIVIHYTNSKNDSDLLRTIELNNEILTKEPQPILPPSSQKMINSDSTPDSIKAILEVSELSPLQIKSIFATKSISHGVDSRNYNSIIFYGMPEYYEEYIQAAARSGRNNVGYSLVLAKSTIRDEYFLNNFIKIQNNLENAIWSNKIDYQAKNIFIKSIRGIYLFWLFSIHLPFVKKNEYYNFPSIATYLKNYKLEVMRNYKEFLEIEMGFQLEKENLNKVFLDFLLNEEEYDIIQSLRETEKSISIEGE